MKLMVVATVICLVFSGSHSVAHELPSAFREWCRNTAKVAVVNVEKAGSESAERANTRNVRRRAELKTMIDARRALAEQYAVIFASICKP